jgi:hypothetical protein
MRNRFQLIYERINTGGMIPGIAGTSKRTTLVIAVIIILASAFGVGYFSSPSKTVNQGTVVTQTVTSSSNADAAGAHAAAAAAAKAAGNAAGNPLRALWSTETVSQEGATPIAVTAEDFSNRMVVYTASISLKVDKVESAITSLQQLTERYKGYVASVYTGARMVASPSASRRPSSMTPSRRLRSWARSRAGTSTVMMSPRSMLTFRRSLST